MGKEIPNKIGKEDKKPRKKSPIVITTQDRITTRLLKMKYIQKTREVKKDGKIVRRRIWKKYKKGE